MILYYSTDYGLIIQSNWSRSTVVCPSNEIAIFMQLIESRMSYLGVGVGIIHVFISIQCFCFSKLFSTKNGSLKNVMNCLFNRKFHSGLTGDKRT